MSNVINFEEYLYKREKAELVAAVQEVRNQVVRNRQGKLIYELHQLINKEREYGLLTEENIIEVTKILYHQISDGVIFE